MEFLYILPFYTFMLSVFVSKELYYFDEEFLVVVSFFTVFTVLFRLLSSIIARELDNRSYQIYDQFKTYSYIQKQSCYTLSSFYEQRSNNL